MREIARSKGIIVFETEEGIREFRRHDNTIVLTTQTKGGMLCFRDYSGIFWPFTDILSVIFEHYLFSPDELKSLLSALRPDKTQPFRKLLTNALSGSNTLPPAEQRIARTILGLIEDDVALEVRRRDEQQRINAFLTPFQSSAEPGILSGSIAEYHERYQRCVASDMCGHNGNCLWWLPASSDNWRFWRQLGWSSPTINKVRELDPEDTQAGAWVLWTPVIQSGDPETILNKIRVALKLNDAQYGSVWKGTPSQLLYLLRRAEHQFNRLPLGDDEVLLTSAEEGWLMKQQVRIRRAPTSTVEMTALDVAFPGSNDLPHRTPAEKFRDSSRPEGPILAPLEILVDTYPPADYVEGIMPIFVVT